MAGERTTRDRYQQVLHRIASACASAGRDPSSVKLVAVTKTASAEQIRELVAAGATTLGENRLQVLEEHAAAVAGLPVSWHMIGHLQRNKVRQVLRHVQMIQSVDSLRLAQEIDRIACETRRRIPVLIEVNAGEEDQKFGAALSETPALVAEAGGLTHLELCGLMTMAPLTRDTSLIARTFARARDLLEQIRPAAGEQFRELSMGMSHDFEIAIQQGATIVRIGSLLFE